MKFEDVMRWRGSCVSTCLAPGSRRNDPFTLFLFSFLSYLLPITLSMIYDVTGMDDPRSRRLTAELQNAGFVEREIKKEEIPILNVGENVDAPPARELIEMESSFDNIENDLKEVIASGDALRKTFLELTEMRHVLHKTQQFFDQVHADPLMVRHSCSCK